MISFHFFILKNPNPYLLYHFTNIYFAKKLLHLKLYIFKQINQNDRQLINCSNFFCFYFIMSNFIKLRMLFLHF